MPAGNPTEAHPRTEEEVALLPDCPDVLAAAQERGITSVVHFTTFRGAVGVLASGVVKSRHRLPKDEYLEYVYQPNANIRKDTVWLDYINLSVERINDWMFDTSTRWHSSEGNSWVVLCFDPQILEHPGVVFTTTNNIYHNCRRAEGLAGFSQMFADSVYGWDPRRRCNVLHNRTDKYSAWPTDRQAEVLYPGELSREYLKRIDVQFEETIDSIHGVLAGLNLSVPVRCAPEVFP